MSYDPAVRNRRRTYMHTSTTAGGNNSVTLKAGDRPGTVVIVDGDDEWPIEPAPWIPSQRQSWLIIGYFVLLCAPTAIVLGALGLSVLWEWLM